MSKCLDCGKPMSHRCPCGLMVCTDCCDKCASCEPCLDHEHPGVIKAQMEVAARSNPIDRVAQEFHVDFSWAQNAIKTARKSRN